MDAETKKKFIEEKTKLVEEYMAEIESQLKAGLELIEQYKTEDKLESDEFQDKIVVIIKKIEFCAATVETELSVEGAPTYYIANGRINIASDGDDKKTNNINNMFCVTNAEEDDNNSDDDDDSDTDSDISFTEEERQHIESPEHYKFLKRYSLKPQSSTDLSIHLENMEVAQDLSIVDLEETRIRIDDTQHDL
jgi:hypothetical protein